MRFNLDDIIISILGLLSIRDLIAQNIDIPKNKSWSWIFYNSKDRKEIPYCYQLNKLHENCTPISYHSDLILKLIVVLGNHTKFFEDGVYCDRAQRTTVKHLVSTIEASYINDDLKIMIDFMEKMLSELSLHNNIDFIISLRGGNVILINELINMHKREIIHISYSRNLIHESTGITISNEHDNLEGRCLKFENFNELLRISEKSNRKLNGVIMDCSFSSGKGIIDCIEEFNKLVNTEGINISPIENVRTLYSHVNTNLKVELNRLNCKIEYLFSLDDEVRKKLYELIYKETNDNKKIENAKIILKSIKTKKLLNTSLVL